MLCRTQKINTLLFIIYFAIFALSGCSTARSIAKKNGFTEVLVQGNEFVFTTFQKITDNNAGYVIYIEGDGTIVNGNQISTNPTPRKPMMIQLATSDPRPNIVYIGRPCQYTPMNMNPVCNCAYWTHKRWSMDAVDAMNDAINKIAKGHKRHLIGFSGGGGIAVLIAARHKNVADIITIGGCLDHEAFNEYHKTVPSTESLNPIDFAKQINHIPQLHISGERDTRVPQFIAKKYIEASNSPCVINKLLPKVSHNSGWIENWHEVLNMKIGGS